MKKTELIKFAINCRVLVEDFEGDEYLGWLVKDNDIKNHYLLLPFDRFPTGNIRSFRVSYIKHLKHLNGNVVW